MRCSCTYISYLLKIFDDTNESPMTWADIDLNWIHTYWVNDYIILAKNRSFCCAKKEKKVFLGQITPLSINDYSKGWILNDRRKEKQRKLPRLYWDPPFSSLFTPSWSWVVTHVMPWTESINRKGEIIALIDGGEYNRARGKIERTGQKRLFTLFSKKNTGLF